MHIAFPKHSLRSALAVAAASALSACHGSAPFEVVGAPSRAFSIAVGEEMTISIGGFGPSYLSPPTISGSAVAFIDMTNPPTAVVTPGGAVQLYRFKGVASGRSVILFHRPDSILLDVIDTVNVR